MVSTVVSPIYREARKQSAVAKYFLREINYVFTAIFHLQVSPGFLLRVS